MASHRNAASRTVVEPGHACADALPVEQEQPVNDKTPSDSSPPHAGRTGNAGARAERPADSRAHKGNNASEPARKGKAPSPAARGDAPGRGGLPQPVRDSTG